MKKITRLDITFIIAMLFFAIVCFSRFWDEKLRTHIVLFEFMQEYEYAIVFTITYFVVLFWFFIVCIANYKENNKKNMYYLICFYATFTFPMFLSANYFGVVDIYAWVLTWIAAILLILGKVEWLTPVLGFMIALISPMSVLTGGSIICAILVYKFFVGQKRKYIFYLLGSVFTSCVGAFASKHLGTFSTDEQHVLSIEKFLVMLLFLSPYIYLAITFFVKLFQSTKSSKRWAYFLGMIGMLPNIVVYICLEDYARVFFHAFTYTILLVILYIVMNDRDVAWQLQRSKDFIKSKVPIPVIVLAIPFLFMTLWIAGEQHLMKEVFINK